MTPPWPIISRADAQLTGMKYYFENKICRNGHIERRYVNTGICYACKRAINKRNAANNPETSKKIRSGTYVKNKETCSLRAKKWAEENPEKIREIRKRNKEKHRQKYLEAEKIRIRNRRAKDPSWRLSKNISKQIWDAMKHLKAGRHWEDFLGFTLDELKAHLEPKFKEGMSWDNYGSIWHLDHIRPLSWFLEDSTDETHEERVIRAFDISNLQPLFKFENLSKNNRFEG